MDVGLRTTWLWISACDGEGHFVSLGLLLLLDGVESSPLLPGNMVTFDPQGQIPVVSSVGASRCPEKWAPRLTSPIVPLAVFLRPWLLPFPLQKTPLFFRQLHALSSQAYLSWSHPTHLLQAEWVVGMEQFLASGTQGRDFWGGLKVFTPWLKDRLWSWSFLLSVLNMVMGGWDTQRCANTGL